MEVSKVLEIEAFFKVRFYFRMAFLSSILTPFLPIDALLWADNSLDPHKKQACSDFLQSERKYHWAPESQSSIWTPRSLTPSLWEPSFSSLSIKPQIPDYLPLGNPLFLASLWFFLRNFKAKRGTVSRVCVPVECWEMAFDKLNEWKRATNGLQLCPKSAVLIKYSINSVILNLWVSTPLPNFYLQKHLHYDL